MRTSVWGKIAVILLGFFAMNFRVYMSTTKPKNGKKYFDYKYSLIMHLLAVLITVFLLVMLIIKG